MAGFLRDLFSVMLSRVGVIIFSLLRGVIIARWLGPEDNGTIAALVVYPSLFMTIGSLGVRQSTAYYVGKQIYSIERIKKTIVQIWFFSSLLSTATSYFLIKGFSNSGTNTLLVILAIAPIPFELFNVYSSGIFLGKNQIQAFNKVNWIPPFLMLLGAALFIIVLNLGIEGALGASIVGSLFMFVFLFSRNDFLNSFSIKIDFAVFKNLVSLGITYAISLLVINLNYKIDVILIDKLSTSYELGIYSKGVALIEYMWQIPMLLSTIIFARSAASKDGVAFSRKTAHLLRLSFIAVGVASAVLIILSDWIIYLLYGKDFLPSSVVLSILMPGVLLLTVFKVLNMDLAGKGKPWIAMKAMIPALLFNCIMNYFFIPNYGANGASLASTISYTVAAILFLHFYSKEVKIPVLDLIRYSKSDFQPILELIQNYKKKIVKA